MRYFGIGLVALLGVAMACGGSTGSPGASGDDGGAGSSSGGSSGSSSGGGSGSSSGSGGDGGKSSSSSGGSSGGSSGSSGGLAMTSAVTITVEPSDDAQGLISSIQNAKTSVHMEMYLLSNSKVIDALISQHQAGHEVKVILNKNFPSTGGDSGSNTSVYTQLQSAGVSVVWAPPGFTYTHEKGVIIDGTSAWIMTMNATQSSPTSNREYLALDTDAADVAEIEAIFQHDYANQGYHASGKLVVSPDNSRAELTTLIGMAKSTIDIECEELSDSGVVSALATAAGHGVTVHIVVADSTTPSATALTTLKGAGVKLNAFSQYYVHAKSMVVDGKYAYVGSVNYTAGSIGYNREVGIITATASEVQKVESTTTSDFAAGSPL